MSPAYLRLEDLAAVHPALRPLVVRVWRMGDSVPAEVKDLEPEHVLLAGAALGIEALVERADDA